MARYRPPMRLERKDDSVVMDEILQAIMNGLTPEQIRKELEDYIWKEMENMTPLEFEEAMEKHEIDPFH